MERDKQVPRASTWLRKSEQAIWACVLTGMLLILGWSFLWQYQQCDRLLDIDESPRLDYQFEIDINQANWPELTVLPGISESFARRIVEHRDSNGDFQSVDDLISVPGIGPKRLEEIRPYLVVRSANINNSLSAESPTHSTRN